MVAGGVTTDGGGADKQRRSSGTEATSTRRPPTADDRDQRTAASAGQSATSSRQPDGGLPISVHEVPSELISLAGVDTEVPPISAQMTPDGVTRVTSAVGETTRNTNDFGNSEALLELKQVENKIKITRNEDERVTFATALGDDDNKDDEVDVTIDDKRDARNDDVNAPVIIIPPTPSTQTLPADRTVNMKSSIVEHQRVPSAEMTSNDHPGNFGPTDVDGEVLKTPTWHGQDDAEATSLLAFNSDTAFKLFEQIVNNITGVSDTNTDNIGTGTDLLQPHTNQTQSTAVETVSDLAATGEFDKGTASPALNRPESTTSSTTFPHLANEKASRPEPTTLNQQITAERSDRRRYKARSSKATTATSKPKLDIFAGNGNSVFVCCRGRFALSRWNF